MNSPQHVTQLSMSHGSMQKPGKNWHGLTYFFLKAHLQGDVDPPQHARHLAQRSRRLVHLVIWKSPTAAT